MDKVRINERHEVVGVYCSITRDDSHSSRWRVRFQGTEIGCFSNLGLARQFAEHRVWAFMRDAIESGDSL